MAQSISYREHQVHLYSEGKGEKILFLHGWPNNANLWQQQVAALKEQYQVLSLDWLGFGQSDHPLNHTYTFTSMKEILATVLDELLQPGEKVTLVAHDIGGPPALLWASEHPERLQRLILLNTIFYPLQTKLDALSDRILHTPLLRDMFVSRLGLKQVLRTNVKSRYPELSARIHQLVEDFLKVPQRVRQKTILEPVGMGRSQETLRLPALFGALAVPKFLIIADRDPLLYAHMKRLQEAFPEVPVYPLPGCSHYIPLDQPAELNAHLQSILKE
ncbi:MAG: alpha/beta hydrolase [Bacteroidota bacterium]